MAVFLKTSSVRIILSILVLYSMMANVTFSAEILSPENALLEIEQLLMTYDRDSAYEKMKSLKLNLNFDQDPEIYLKNLQYLVNIEKMYFLSSDMVKNAIELYRLTEDSQYTSYRIDALEALSYFDYLNYDNSKAAAKLAEMAMDIDINQSVQYKSNLALLEIDARNFDRALALYEEILVLKQEKMSSVVLDYFNERTIIYNNIAFIYFEQEKKDKDIESTLLALSYIGESDYDYLVDTKLSLANFYYFNGAFDKAQQYVDEIYMDFDKTSELFSNVFSIKAVKNLEANLAYDAGDYKKASEIFFALNQKESDSTALENTLEGNKTLTEFETSQTHKQLDTLEQLASVQVNKNEVQKKFLTAATVIIVLLLILIFTFVWMINWYNKQRRYLYQLSITDQLTQLYNRRMIIQEFEHIKIGTKCIALMDIDNFKCINDQYGHVVGDKVLIKIAETIQHSLRSNDIVGRYGGEEFLAILDTEDMSKAIEISERIRENVAQIEWEYPDLITTISIGLTKVTQQGDLLLAEADHLLYQSKENGRNLLTYKPLCSNR